MEELALVAEYDKVRRADADLRHVVDLQSAAAVRRRLHARLRVGQNVVEHAGRDAHAGLVVHVVDHLKKARYALARRRRDEEDGRIGHVGEVAADVVAHFVHGLAVLFDKIPLVHDDDAGLACLVREARDLRILLGHALLRVDHDEAHVRTVNGHRGAQHAVALDHIVDLRLFAHAGGVDEDILALLVFKVRVDGVARRARNIADDHALGAENAVRQR